LTGLVLVLAAPLAACTALDQRYEEGVAADGVQSLMHRHSRTLEVEAGRVSAAMTDRAALATVWRRSGLPARSDSIFLARKWVTDGRMTFELAFRASATRGWEDGIALGCIRVDVPRTRGSAAEVQGIECSPRVHDWFGPTDVEVEWDPNWVEPSTPPE